MEKIEINIDHLPLETLLDKELLHHTVYSNMNQNYYWSDDFSATYYVAQAKAGFIAVTEEVNGELVLIPEIQYAYALLDFKDLHVSRNVEKLLKRKAFTLEITQELDEVYRKINGFHKKSWVKKKYLDTLNEVNALKGECQVVAVTLKEGGEVVAGELGYIIGNIYTSLSGFSSRKRAYRNYGTVQLVLLADHLDANGFAFMNLGQPYMDYKVALGAKIYGRKAFLERWFEMQSLSS